MICQGTKFACQGTREFGIEMLLLMVRECNQVQVESLPETGMAPHKMKEPRALQSLLVTASSTYHLRQGQCQKLRRRQKFVVLEVVYLGVGCQPKPNVLAVSATPLANLLQRRMVF